MGRLDGLFETVTDHSRIIIALMLVLTVAVGAGAGGISQSSSLDQFQSDSEESKKLSYIESNFSTGSDNTTSTQLIVRDDNVLDKATLVDMIELEQRLQANETIGSTLAENNSVVGISNVVATAAIQREIGGELQGKAAKFERLNATVAEESAALKREQAALQERSTDLNETVGLLRNALDAVRANPNADIRTQFERVQANSSVEIADDYATFETAAKQLRNATSRDEAEAAYRQGTQGVLAEEFAALQQRGAELEDRGQELETKASELKELGQELADLQAELEANSNPSLDAQLEQLRSMNQSEIDDTLSLVLGADSSGGGAFAFMPTSYEPGSTSTNATMLIVTHASGGGAATGTAPESITDAQLAMQTVTNDAGEVSDVLVFGAGIISDEINRSMADSLAIVGPLALLFVVVALAIAYRDLIDIVLGVFGIGVVLVWTFGFMGWADIAFNQMMIAVPVLLIGLSIDYAIHIFMRHREERNNRHTASDVRGAMRVGLVGVGVALLFVTATTVIGFLANLTSPIPPIKDFGVVSAVGISAAMLVFGGLIPALKVEIDEFLEDRLDRDRKKTAFGTGGGRFSSVLAVGSTAARKAPYAVIVVALLVSAGGAYGATQVDTSFNQEDFLAQDPPEFTKDLPEPFAPSDYTAKDNLEYVNKNFLREDSQAQLLVQGDVATPDALDRLDAARDAAADKDSVQVLSNGEPNIQGPLSVMETVAAENETFNATFADADTDGDGVPDRNVGQVYGQLYEVAPDQAAGVIHQTDDGDYAAARLVISVNGGASSTDVTEQMRAIADTVSGSGLEATATGQTILFKIVQDNLLQTVIESLLITLVAVVAFLMITYRIAEGSATLGFVTILPVILSVSWILGTMFLLDIPFNILTGMITSLTVGLGVAYSIHLSERYNQELERADSMWEAMQTAVTGTGGALLGSAATTVGGFGVLAFAILPPLQQFGIITGITIIYAFLASVLVLPSLLVVWTRYVGPDDATAVEATPSAGEVPAED
ncbi:MMPL family transporter [Halorubellus sp. PRR65]|uniref:MMPL family transporter n=1 Tax=Halorubellus sp. PRR65 TaxID=3098148 RepID=UPI002B25B2F8|nr:MMPL family transporter [Halorubellus sp. PRR65]